MKKVIYAETAQAARRARRPRSGETLAYRSFEDFKGAEKGYKSCEIIGECENADEIIQAYEPKPKTKGKTNETTS